ncbi:MAG TPA: hypothetical protein VEP50_11150 [bacterium]|nr:hypothetical protein [bacterium]
MKKRLIVARKITKAKLARAIQRGRALFYGARSRAGAKDPKDLRGIKGLLVKSAEDDEDRARERS